MCSFRFHDSHYLIYHSAYKTTGRSFKIISRIFNVVVMCVHKNCSVGWIHWASHRIQ